MFVEVCVFSVVYTTVRLLVWYFNRLRAHKKFAERGIPGPKPSLFDGNLYELRKNVKLQHEVIGDWLQKYGNVVGYYLGEQRYLVINDLDALQQIFISNTRVFRNRPTFILNAKPIIDSILVTRDDHWRRARRVMSPTFANNKVTSPPIMNTIELCVDSLVNKIRSFSKGENEPFEANFYPAMQAASLDVIARTALNIETDVHNEKNELLHAVREYFSEAQNIAIELATLLPFLRPLMTFVNNNMTAGKMTDMAVRHLHGQLNEAAKNPVDIKAQNFLHSMMASFATGNLTKDELIGNSHLILLAGYETTANATTYMLYMLAKNPDVQDKLRQYFEDEKNKEEVVDYFEMVWFETLRILPVVTLFLVREATEDIVINGISIEKNTVVQAPVWQIHHNEDYWPEPDLFSPDRFLPENRKTMHPMAFVPFGSGPRLCLGMQLAFHEAKRIVSRFVTQFKIELGKEFIDPLPLSCSTVLLNPATDVTFKFTPLQV